ncbi:MAG: hypothetical protein GY909_15130 [Oligoflexia bacterium]|nr:hypothetical protein [Oligoflexia bacterium]
MNKLLVLLLLFSSVAFATPEKYQSNSDIKTESIALGDKTFFTFGFRDRKGVYNEWKWNNNTAKMNELSKAFGLYNKDPDNFTYFPEELPKGLYKEHFLIGILPDYSALVEYYYSSVIELYQNWKLFSSKANLSKRESIELLLSFFQDFPYAMPPKVYDDRLISGLFVPPLVFKNGWADCDSKSLLMATVLSHDPFFRNKIAMILVPGHALLGINILPQVYDETYSFRNKKYVVAEPTGLGRTPLGRKNSPYSKVLAIEPITLDSIPSSKNNGLIKVLSASDCKNGALLIDYVSPVKNVRVQMCQKKVDGKFIKHGPEIIFDVSGNPAILNTYKDGEKI